MQCNVCGNDMGLPAYEAASDFALTSLCELRQGRIRVWSCAGCSHLRGEALADTAAYYESGYRILLDHDEEDQIYDVVGDRIVFRTEHQVRTMLEKLELPSAATVLDYGCAKASTPKRLMELRPDLRLHLFDVSHMYRKHWERFLAPDACAVHSVPPDWSARFDVVTSFFALEHIVEPIGTVRQVADLLKESGVFYGVVPDVSGNLADFVVMDHVNHFTPASLHLLLRKAGFAAIAIDSTAHRGALVFQAAKAGAIADPSPVSVPACRDEAKRIIRYWQRLDDLLAEAARSNAGRQSAIYGSGFYGAYIASRVGPESITCFLDASPFQQGKRLFGKPILAPGDLPEAVRVLYVGLNPAIGREVVSRMPWVAQRGITPVFLDLGE